MGEEAVERVVDLWLKGAKRSFPEFREPADSRAGKGEKTLRQRSFNLHEMC